MIFTSQKSSSTTATHPLKIVCLVPSITELLYYLRLELEVIGITKFCVHPHNWFTTKVKVGGTKNIDIEKIKQLKPTLVIANKEENVKEQIETIASFTDVILTDIETVEDALTMIEQIGLLTNTQEKAFELIEKINHSFLQLSQNVPLQQNKKVAYLIWQNPYMTVGSDTYIHAILAKAGLVNVFEDTLRYPITTIEQLKAKEPDYVFLSSEPFPFKEKHSEEIAQYLPNSKVLLVNGEMFSWYGSKLLETPNYLSSLLKKL